ncbi:MAG: hypothetical protein IKR34_04675 [Candidatus Gastranaerophilales bacterium]|nr:hypothetical protein [Candidatus Gastranaerophilales bacterium]
MNNNILKDIKKGENLFIVDLESVSMFNSAGLNAIARDEKRYQKTPFLFLIASLNRNEALKWADENFKYENKIKTGSWMVYKFKNL